MWHINASDHIFCYNCSHPITQGTLCISDLPVDIPNSVSRNNHRYFHFDCPECERPEGEFSSTCYQEFARCLVSDRADEDSVCLTCGHLIPEGNDRIQDYFYVRDAGQGDVELGEQGPAALLAALLKGQRVNNSALSGFSYRTINKFKRAGIRNKMRIRSLSEAEGSYRTWVPRPVRNLGEDAVGKFTNGKDASHIRSVANAPHLARDPQNIILESVKANTKRGSRNMTRLELAKARGLNSAHAAKIVGKTAAKQAGKGAAFAALVELPITLVESGICVYRGKKSRQEAFKDSCKDLTTAGAAGAVMGAGTTAVVALGGGAALAAVGPVLVPMGVGILAVSTGNRLWKAWKDDLNRIELNFHADCPDCESTTHCYPDFAEWVGGYSPAAVGEYEGNK